MSKIDQTIAKAEPVFILAEQDVELSVSLHKQWPKAQLEILPGLSEAIAESIQDNFLQLLKLTKKAIQNLAEHEQPFLVFIPEHSKSALYGACLGLLKTAHLEHAKLTTKVIHYQLGQFKALLDNLVMEMCSPDDEVRYSPQGQREIKRLKEIALSDVQDGLALQAGDVVWMTGGLGGIGQQFAQYLGVTKKVKLILSGRSPLGDVQEKWLTDVRQQGANVNYLQQDVADEDSVKAIVKAILAEHGRLTGIIHSAGVIHDGYLHNKQVADVVQVLRPKIAGLLAIHEAVADIRLDFMVLFSSIAGVLGNIGQADYASANAFLDAFAYYRNQQVVQGRCFGKTLSLNWPLWQDGGMRMAEQNAILMQQATGMMPMDSASGIRAFELALHSSQSQVLVAYGDVAVIRSRLLSFSPRPEQQALVLNQAAKEGIYDGGQDHALTTAVNKELLRLVSEIQDIPAEKISLEQDLSNYGFDSITFTEFSNHLNKLYGLTLMPTLFFELSNLAALGRFLVEHHQPALRKKHALQPLIPTVNTSESKTQSPKQIERSPFFQTQGDTD